MIDVATCKYIQLEVRSSIHDDHLHWLLWCFKREWRFDLSLEQSANEG